MDASPSGISITLITNIPSMQHFLFKKYIVRLIKTDLKLLKGLFVNINFNHIFGTLCIITGLVVIIFAVGSLALRLLIAVLALSIINYGLKLRRQPSLQMIIATVARRNRWFY
jgi:sorbitol-specific phosphotransferase system component IIC